MGQAREVVERWCSLSEADRLGDTAEICQPDVDVSLPGVGVLHGPFEVTATRQAFREAFPIFVISTSTPSNPVTRSPASSR